MGELQAAEAPTLFLMVGLPGSGKTVRARELAAEHGALQLTPDAWMLALFGQEDRHQTRPDGKRWLLEGRLVALAIDVLRRGVSVVLDFGLWSRDERSALRWIAISLGASCEVVYLPVERQVQWSRIEARWRKTPDQTFPMAEDELDGWEEGFEVPDADELSGSPVPSPPPGKKSWFDWAQRFWISLAHSVNGPPIPDSRHVVGEGRSRGSIPEKAHVPGEVSGVLATAAAATVTLFCGLPGSGKTTLARQLAEAGKGVRICTDEWQHALGVAHTDAGFHERLQRLLYRHAIELLHAGCDVILEDGLWRAEERAEKFRDARACRARIELHVFDVPMEELWSRLQDRNGRAAGGAAPMTREELERAWSVFEPPTAGELASVDEWWRHQGPLASDHHQRGHTTSTLC